MTSNNPARVGVLSHAVLLVAVIGLVALTLHQLVVWLDRPEVQVSHTTGMCVEVVDYRARAEGRESEWSCDRLPESYQRIWVQ